MPRHMTAKQRNEHDEALLKRIREMYRNGSPAKKSDELIFNGMQKQGTLASINRLIKQELVLRIWQTDEQGQFLGLEYIPVEEDETNGHK